MSWIKIEFRKDEPKENKNQSVDCINCEQITSAIVQASIKLDEIKKEEEEKQKQDTLANRRRILKEKDFSYIKCPIWREIRVFFNNLRIAWNLLTLTREESKHFTAVNVLTRLLTSLLLYAIGLSFYALAGFFVYKTFFAGGVAVEYMPYIVVPIVFARLIRIARFEVERMKSETQLTNIAMLLITIVTLAATIVGTIISAQTNGG